MKDKWHAATPPQILSPLSLSHFSSSLCVLCVSGGHQLLLLPSLVFDTGFLTESRDCLYRAEEVLSK